jgi:hypothetical protein
MKYLPLVTPCRRAYAIDYLAKILFLMLHFGHFDERFAAHQYLSLSQRLERVRLFAATHSISRHYIDEAATIYRGRYFM